MDPQPASINPTINISIVFICAFLVDCGQIICHPAIENPILIVELLGRTILHVFLKNGTQSELIEPQFKSVLFGKSFDFGFPVLELWWPETL
jgi:hypothetical protein